MKCSVFIATSLDGFIARENESLDWLNEANKKIPAGEDCGYAEFVASIDAVVMGRKTFEHVLTFPEWPFNIPVFVLSHSLKALPQQTPNNVFLTPLPPNELVRDLAAQGKQHLYIDGGQTIQAFLSAGLVNEINITVVPVLIGAGLALFGETKKDLQLEHVFTKTYEFGYVQTKYKVKKPS